MSDDYWPECNGDHGYFEDQMEKLRARLAEVERERDEVRAENKRFLAALEKVNAIRNSIVGLQTFNFSEHAYPLVAALNAAGFEGLAYPESRANVGTLLERAAKAEAEVERLRAVVEAARQAYRADAVAEWFDAEGDGLRAALAALDAKG